MEIVQSIMTNNPCYKAGKKIAVKGLMLHSVGCPQPSAEVFIRNWNNPEQKRACVHAFIDGNTGKTYQTLPWDHRAWHAGGGANNTHIGVEMCEPSCIQYTGGATFTCTDWAAAMEVVKRTYDAAVELFAYLCREYHLDPLADGVVISHKEGHERGIASGHGDPNHLWNGLQSGYTMDAFRRDVKDAMGQMPLQEPAKTAGPQTGQPQEIAGPQTGQPQEIAGPQTGQPQEIAGPQTGQPQEIARPQTGQPQEIAGPQTGQPQEEMHISDRGVDLIARYEGCRLEAYKCPAGVWTIGYGHTAGVKEGDTLASEEAAKALLKGDLSKYGGYVNACVKKGMIGFVLTQNMFDALTSFCYNCGNGNLQKLVTGRDAVTVADKMLLYNKGGGKVLPGLARRREEERELFLS